MVASLEESITKHVLKNTYDYGKPNPASIVGKVIGEHPECKSNMKSTMAKINQEASRISGLSKKEIEKEMENFEYTPKKEEKKEIDLPNAETGMVVVRYPPEPNGWPHIGHAKAFTLSWSVVQKYGGKIILRWDDTNPEAEKPEFIRAIRNGIIWLGLSFDEELYSSDYLDRMYELGEKLIGEGNAYYCTCTQDETGKNREKMKNCVCHDIEIVGNLEGWKRMKNGTVREGGATIRLKGNIKSQNTVMRDPTLFRIITAPHYRQGTKYRVWPTYDFQGAVMDSILGITHPIRSKEYELRDELYNFLLTKLGLRIPTMITISRLAIKNAPISKRLLRPLVESGKLWGWDDPRLPTLAGLERKGILPEAIREFVLSFGISKVESEPDLEILLSLNRKLLDPQAKHFFFVQDVVELVIEGLDKHEVKLKYHPKKEAYGFRQLTVDGKVHLSSSDAKNLVEGETFRLKDLCNVKLIKKGKHLSGQLMPDDMVEKKIQWVGENKIECKVFVPKQLLCESGEFNVNSMELLVGFCESNCLALEIGEVIQFERLGFCRLDKKSDKKLEFIFTC